jgi:voltage-gated potassium channel
MLGLGRLSRRSERPRPAPTLAGLWRIRVALVGLVVVLGLGTLGYILLPVTADGSTFDPLEALYQTVTTVATVGFREVHPLSDAGQIFTMVLIILGAGTVLYNLGLLVEAFTEGHLRQHMERRRMDQHIDGLSGHVIICGFGRVGRSAADQLIATGHDVVVIDRDATRLAEDTIPYLIGEATNNQLLVAAGIGRARALVASLDSDAETVYLTLSARALAPDLVIVARARTADSKEKLVLAGATRAVNPQMIGGRRLAAFALQPDVAEFLDVVMHDDELDFRIQQVAIGVGSPFVGRTLKDLDIRHQTGVQLLALRPAHHAGFTFSSPPDSVVHAGCVLIGFGTLEGIETLERLARA